MNEWRKIKLRSVNFLCWDAPERLRWTWTDTTPLTGPQVQLVSPRGVAWELKLNGAAWIRRAEAVQ